ncbi:MAG: hypothetical protein JNK58_07155 [Phycisphaerae bacterium]|nr:hypothetical protein [Phycisphaerae bacterium]
MMGRGVRGWGLIAALIAGSCWSIGYGQQPSPPGGVPPESQDKFGPAPKPVPPHRRGETPEQRRAREALEQRNREQAEIRRQMQEKAMEGQQPVDESAMLAPPTGVPATPAVQLPGQVRAPGAAHELNVDQQPLPEGAVQHLEGDGFIRLNFGAESVSLDAFVDYVSQVLQINITPDPAIAQQQIMFRAPMEIPKEKLLPLLAAIVEDKGFALIEDPMLGYFIRAAGAVPVDFGEEGGILTTRLIRTPMIKPSAVQGALQPLVGSAPANLRYSPMDDLGVLIVTGPPRAVEMVERFVDRILDEIAGQSLHRFQLVNVEAGYARSRVLTLNGKLGGASAPVAPGGAGGGGGGGGALANLDSRIIVDQGNSLIFRGTDDESSQVKQLIGMVDIVTPLVSRRYSAGSVANEIAATGEREGLGPVQQSGGGGGGFSPQRGGLLGPNVGGGGAGAGGAVEVNTSGFTVDTEAGSLIYSGTEQQHKRVAELVKNFTEHIVGSRVDIRMYKLHNAEAASVADLLTQLIQDPSQSTQTGTSPFLPASRVSGQRAQRSTQANAPALEAPEPAAAAAGEEGATGASSGAPVEISIVPDEERNQLLVKAPARQQSEIEQIIKRLDERRPQVYVEAQIVAINTTKNFDWTVETQINAGQFLLFSNFGLSTAGTAPPGGQAAQGTRIVPTGRTGLTSAVIKSDYLPFVLNTLASKTDSKIVSNPRILVNDNETADLRSEREEPFATTTQGTATTTTGQGGVATAGTSLSVTPRISKGGYISLTYEIELSDFVGAPVAGLQPPTQREQYSSSVTIPSDSTIIVGGFNLTRKSETDSGIPILKDIPILGMLFKSFNVTDRRTTIFVFITPKIMTDPNFIDLRLASEGPMEKSGIEGITPALEPVLIRIEDSATPSGRLVPSNEAPSGP